MCLDFHASVGGRRPPTRGGRDLSEEFTFTTFCDWIRHELEEELQRRWYVKANGVGVPETYGPMRAAG